MSERDERDLVEVPENAMRDDPLAFGLTAPQLGLAGVAVAVAFVLNLLPLWLPLRLTLAVLVAAPVFGVAVVSIRGEPGYRWLVRFVRFVRSDKTWGLTEAEAGSPVVSDHAPNLARPLQSAEQPPATSLQEGPITPESVDTVRSAAPSVQATPAESADLVAAPREPRAMGEEPARLRLVAGDADERPSSDDRPPDDSLPAPSGLPHLLRGLRLVCFVSFAGGVGKTTLAVEAATLIGSTARYLDADGRSRPVEVLVLDAARVAPAAGLRLGIPAPALARSWSLAVFNDPLAVRRVAKRSDYGVRLLALPPHPRVYGRIGDRPDDFGVFSADAASVVLEGAQHEQFALVVADLGSAEEEGHRQLIDQADLVVGVVRPTIESLPDALRVATAIRGQHMGRKLVLVANHADDDTEAKRLADEADVELVGVVPASDEFVRAGNAGEPAWRRAPELRASLLPIARIVWPYFAEANGRHPANSLLRRLIGGRR